MEKPMKTSIGTIIFTTMISLWLVPGRKGAVTIMRDFVAKQVLQIANQQFRKLVDGLSNAGSQRRKRPPHVNRL
jgi:hypothetical protein